MPIRPPEERMALSRFDTVFLFSFTMIAVVSSLLSALIGPLRGLLPVLILLITVYPFYTGIWHGIMNDKVAERLFAWEYLVIQFMYLVTAFISSVLFTHPLFDAFSGITLSGIQLGGIISAALKLLMIFIILLTVARLLFPRFSAVQRVFRENLPSTREEISKKEYGKIRRSHSKVGSMFQSITVIIEVFAIQEWELAIGIVATYPIPYSLAGVPIIALLFVFVWFWTYIIHPKE